MAKGKKLVWILKLLMSIMMVGCGSNDHNLAYKELSDGEHLIKCDLFQIKTPDCYKMDFDGIVGDEGNIIGSLECEENVISFEYGRLLSEINTDTSAYSYSYFEEGELEGVIKHQKGGYPKVVELLLREVEAGEEYGYIKQSLFMSTLTANSGEESLIDNIYKTVRF